MHPFLQEGVTLGTFQYEGSCVTHYYIENADGEEFEVGRSLWNALLRADGTRPLSLPDKGRKILPALKRRGLVQTSRFVRCDGVFNRFILFPIGNRLRSCRPLCRIVNALLPLAALLLFIPGVYLLATASISGRYHFNGWLYAGLLIASLPLHELGHLIAGLAYGYKIRDTGILLLGTLPIGAYVAHEDKENAPQIQQIQFALAGVEADLLFAGLCLLLAFLRYPLSLTLILAANVNIILAGINLLPVSGLDGEAALSALFGIRSISATASRWLFSRKRRQKLLRSGFPGYACLCVFLITFASKILLGCFICLDIFLLFSRL